MSVRRTLIMMTLALLLIPALLFSQRARLAQRQETGRSLQLHTVQADRVEVAVTAVGSIEADEVVRLSFSTPGRVAELPVQLGDYVTAGDVLVRLKSDLQRIAYDQAALALNMAEIRLQDLIENPVDESRVRIAQGSLNNAWGAYTSLQNAVTGEDIREAELRYEQALAALADASAARVNADADQPEQAYLLLDAQVGQASFNAEIARIQLEALRSPNSGQLNAAYARVIVAQRELEQARAGPSQAQLDRAAISMQQAQTALDQAQANLNETVLTAPFDGVVSALNVEVGSLVGPGAAVVELTDVSPLRLTVQVDEVDIGQVREAMAARVQFDALPGVLLPARVANIALVGQIQDGIVNYPVRLVFDSLDPQVRVGMTAEAAVIVESRDSVLVVPNIYIRRGQAAELGFVNLLQADGTLEEVEIQLGLQGQDTSEVTAGLKAGDVIAVDLSGQRFSFFGG